MFLNHLSSPFLTLSVQVLGKVPTISINKTDGCHVYLSADSLACEIVSAKSSEMNILVPGKDGDFVSNEHHLELILTSDYIIAIL